MARMASMDSAYGNREYREEPGTMPPASTNIPLDVDAPEPAAFADAASNIYVLPGGGRSLGNMFSRKAGSGARIVEGGSDPAAFGTSRF